MRAALCLTALLATGVPATAQDVPGTEFTFGLWRGAAQTDAAGAFTHCYATLVFSGGDQLWINVSANPMASPANPLCAFSSVEPRIISKNMKVMINSIKIAASKL